MMPSPWIWLTKPLCCRMTGPMRLKNPFKKSKLSLGVMISDNDV